ncbi:hypothetical protein [Clostridium sp.]|uniref:hypothetical protein n=1 Tax=Clostridium sp. TaxID=1506 RepID=UPI00261E72B8|nr:hypothetical protein [Clostridium sp.]
MNFVEKLISDTKNKKLDYVWKYNDGAKTYSYNFAPKDPMNGMIIFQSKNNLIIFPNGFGLKCDRNQLDILVEEINKSLTRTVSDIIKNYISTNIGNDGNSNRNTDETETNNETNNTQNEVTEENSNDEESNKTEDNNDRKNVEQESQSI